MRTGLQAGAGHPKREACLVPEIRKLGLWISFQGHRDKIPQTGGLKQQTFMVSQFWRPEF